MRQTSLTFLGSVGSFSRLDVCTTATNYLQTQVLFGSRALLSITFFILMRNIEKIECQLFLPRIKPWKEPSGIMLSVKRVGVFNFPELFGKSILNCGRRNCDNTQKNKLYSGV